MVSPSQQQLRLVEVRQGRDELAQLVADRSPGRLGEADASPELVFRPREPSHGARGSGHCQLAVAGGDACARWASGASAFRLPRFDTATAPSRCDDPEAGAAADPIDRASRPIGTIRDQRVSSFAQSGQRGPRRMRQPPVAATISSIVAPSARLSMPITTAILVPARGGVRGCQLQAIRSIRRGIRLRVLA